MWQEQVKRADERCQKFKSETQELVGQNQVLLEE